MVAFIRSDLEFILEQIAIADAGGDDGSNLINVLPNVQVPWGLRTVSGEFNNLVTDQSEFGAADTLFPRLLDPAFRNEGDENPFPLGPPPAPVVINTDYGVSGNVVDTDPRIISNLIVDQTPNNPAAVAANGANPGGELITSPGLDGIFGTADDRPVFFIPNVTPDGGLGAPFNAWMTFFGQFFDHGLDLVTKNSTETIFIPLQPDDPLIRGADNVLGTSDDLAPQLRFMVLSRATVTSVDGVRETENTTSPFVDQNQTYTSHPSHQVFLREYTLGEDGHPHATGRLITNHAINPDGTLGAEIGGMATWEVVKAQAHQFLGINLTDANVSDVPLLATDLYGNFIPDPDTGMPQVITTSGLVSGNLAAPISLANAISTHHQFLIDIAHDASPVDDVGTHRIADDDSVIGLANPVLPLSNGSFEDDVLGPPGSFTLTAPQDWTLDGFGGVYKPTEDIISAAGHTGDNVAFIDNGGTLSRDTDVVLQQGGIYQLTFRVGNRTDQDDENGTVRLLTADGDLLATGTITPSATQAGWVGVTVRTGPISAANAGETLRIEIQDGGAGNSQLLIDDVQLKLTNAYDDELLNAHYMAGDGRVNENIGLTAVHAIFHSEHNRLVQQTKDVVLASNDLAFLKQWVLNPEAVVAFPTSQEQINALEWDGERLFQAAKFGTEMQYQHLVFEEFARTIQPMVDEFLAPLGYDTTIDPSIVAEFAHTVYRFGHSMLTEQFDRLDPDFQSSEIGLIAAFLNPLAYVESGPTPEEATGAIVRGLTRQVGNEIDEFVTEALRNNLLGLPLDLPAINIARGRDTGIPPLNAARKEFFQMTGDEQLKPYISWADFVGHLKHPESLINFIAAYGTHPLITAETTLEGKRAAAFAIVMGVSAPFVGAPGTADDRTILPPGDRLDFLNSTGTWANNSSDHPNKDVDGVTTTGLGSIDLWIGGLAEEIMPFGGMLGSTFNFVFETQLEALQNGDRFYYLSRTAGMNFGTELEQNSFAKLVMLNTDVTHLPDAIFSTPTWVLEVDPTRQHTGLGTLGRDDPTGGIFIGDTEVTKLVIRDNPATPGNDTNYLQYTGEDHVVLGGTAGNDIIISGDGDDTVYGDAGNDRLEGGFGNDILLGGAGDDIIQDQGGDDNIQGGDGNDVIQVGNMEAAGAGNLVLGGAGQDFIITTEDVTTTFGGLGNDFILGAKTNLPATGNEGDDWIEMGTQDGAPGDNFAPLLADNVIGHDIFIGGGGFDEMIGEGGDDIFVGSDAQDKMDGMSGYDWVTYKNDIYGVTADLALPIFGGVGEFGDHIAPPFAASPSSILDRFAEVEGLSGTAFTDILRGDNVDATTIVNHGGATGSALTNLTLINGLAELLGISPTAPVPEAGFVGGNIILGGAGGDIIEGRGGDDVIDGDAWLNVRISVRANADGTGAEIASFDSMTDMIPLMLNRTYNPGQLVAVREILSDPAHPGFDTAVFSGNIAQYIVTRNGDGSVSVADQIVNRDGTDRLTHIERLQFADGNIVLVPGLNSEPTGLTPGSLAELTILDAATNTPDATPTEGQLLRVSIAGVRDADNITATNPTGTITGTISYIWQFEPNPGSGVFEDIIAPPVGDLAFQSANGTVFRVTPDLAGLALRVKAIYVDGHGTAETVFSAPTDAVADIPNAPPTTPVNPTETTSGGEGIKLARSDLSFILDQIKIAEHHADGEDLLSLVPNVRAAAGLRTVSGEFNNLVNFGGVDQSQFGAADNLFPHVTTPVFNTAEAPPPGFGPPGAPATSYNQTSGSVFDAQPRTISNLVVDQTANNPSAYATAYDPGANGHLDFGVTGPANDDVLKDGVHIVTSPGLDGIFDTTDDREVFFFENVAPDAGLSAPFNAWFTFFGQFFDHGLDLVTKGGNGTIFIPLKADDPLVAGADGEFGTTDDLPAELRFMTVSRATQFTGPGADGVLGTADDTHHETQNTTSPFVDQNQTYSSHPSHQVFLREYALDAEGHPHATGRLITNHAINPDGTLGAEIGGMATWEVVKAQARQFLGINLTDKQVSDVPLLATDEYGNFIADLVTGMPQVVTTGGLVSGNLAVPISLDTAISTHHQFLIDIAHEADPSGGAVADGDNGIGGSVTNPATGQNLIYDDELLDAHYMAGDGRVNENIGLTAVHAIFHSEHNRLVDQVKHTLIETVAGTGDLSFINEWLLTPVTAVPTIADIGTLDWNGERLFQAAKFGTEMQYQHLVFEEFARTIQPNVDAFFAPTQVYDVNLDASIVAEFAHTVYRFGHSMLTETVDRFDPNFNSVDGDPQLGLIAAFLNPLAFAASGPTPEQATGAIVRGVTRSIGNEIDEFVTEALRNNLLGLPLDLPAINLARGRDVGIPSLNAVRRQIYDQTGDSELKPYTSWADLVQHLKHPESVINFIAAYGTHGSITSATTLADKRAAATLLVLGGAGEPGDRIAFLNSTGVWASAANGVTTTGLDAIDLWIGGLAEEKMPFGGMLGSTFNFIFENQLEKLQDGDRFYYLERTAGLSFNAELEGNSFAKLIMANTDAVHLPGLVFSTPAFTLEVDPSKQFTGEGANGRADPVSDDPLAPLVIRDNPETPGSDTHYVRYTGEDHIVLGGTELADTMISGDGDDTLWGDGGDDRMDGGYGNDQLRGGAGDDIITDLGGDDNIQGGDGNDVIHGGNGINLIIGGFGQDFIVTGEDANESFGGQGNDFIFGTKADEQNMGNEGDDWIEHGTSDGSPGDNFDPLGNDPIAGNDVYIGSGEMDKFNAEGGDDIMVGSAGMGDRYVGSSGYDWATFKNDPFGVTIDLTNRFFDQPVVPGSGASVLTRFDFVEGLSGSAHADVLQGDDADAAAIAAAGANGSVLTNFALIEGLEALLGNTISVTAGPNPVRFFDGGNIILGGDGSDIIEGRGGNDVIDGDAWLNVRISVRQNADGTGPEIATFDSMEPMIPLMLNRTYNPGQLQVVREIKYAEGPDFDTAKFSGNFIDLGADGVLGGGDDVQNYTIVTNADGSVTVTDLVGTDGTDTLKHIERLQFADQSFVLGGADHAPTGLLTLSGSPTEDQELTVSIAGVHDADNFSATNPTGAIQPPVAYFWQVETVPGSGIYEDILLEPAAGEAARVGGLKFTPSDAEVGLNLRVRALYKDALGVLEEVYSAPQLVQNVDDLPVGVPTISDTTPTEDVPISASILGISDADGLAAAVFSFQWQRSAATPSGWEDIPLATAQLFFPGATEVGHQLRVLVTFTDDHGTTYTLPSAATGATGDHIVGTGGANTLAGTPFDDWIQGLGGTDSLTGGDGSDTLEGGNGNDTLNGGNGIDVLVGGAGTDLINGGAGNDVISYTVGDGADNINGAGDTDTLNIIGTIGSDTLNVSFNGTLTGVGGGAATLASVEVVTAGLEGGIDTLVYTAGSTAVTVNLATHSASGFTSIFDIENVTGGGSNDTLIGDASSNALSGAGGNDLLSGGADGDTLTGGAGSDTASYASQTGAMVINLATGIAQSVPTGGEDMLVTIENAIGGSGNDTMTGSSVGGAPGNNMLDGGAGSDVIDGGAGNDTLLGGAGTDSLTGGTGADSIDGGAGNDTIVGGANNDTLLGGAGDDTFNYTVAVDGIDQVNGGDGLHDLLNITGDNATNTLRVTYNGTSITAITGEISSLLGVEHVKASLLGGNDLLDYGPTNVGVAVNLQLGTASGFSAVSGPAISGIDTVIGGSGADALTGDGNANLLSGGGGDDVLNGGLGNDALVGGGGTDTASYAGETANMFIDLVNGQARRGSLASPVEDTFTSIENATGGGGNDTITANGGANVLNGGAGNDNLSSGGGVDVLIGGTGDDTMNSGAGSDTFVFDAGFGHDVIAQFGDTAGNQDVLDFSTTVFANVAAVQAASTQVGTDVHIDFDAAHGVILLNFALANLTADDLIFH